jgi:hypothetical protein
MRGDRLLPPPVILVHRLWGDQTSLENVEGYLQNTAPWQSQGLIVPISYSKYFAFDHVIVTIDTPELGSAVATYLIANSGKKFAYREASLSGAFWALGGCSFQNDTVETCFAKLGMPLTARGYPLSQGAVYSLEPGGQSISSLPPSIPNAILAATDAIWPDQDKPASLLKK